jgi:hypothetical protein
MGDRRAGADTRSTMRHRPSSRPRNARPTPGHDKAPEAPGLELCPACATDYVNPVEWSAIEDHSWWMLLRCAQCDHTREVTVSNTEAERYDAALDSRADPIARAAHRLDLERMAATVESLIVALQRDLIGPADFAR